MLIVCPICKFDMYGDDLCYPTKDMEEGLYIQCPQCNQGFKIIVHVLEKES